MNLEALDELNRARAFIELAKMACRSGDDDLDPIATGLCAALEHMGKAEEKLQAAL
jgi:hypothetical protein